MKPVKQNRISAKRTVKRLLGYLGRYSVALFGTRSALVLSYHSISRSPWIHAVEPEEFRKQMLWLKERAEIVPLAELEKVITERGWSRTRRPKMAIVFDDGYNDWVTNALPILKELEIPATFFVTANFSSVTSQLHEGLEVLTLDDLKKLVQAGFEIGSHSLSHQDFSVCDPETAKAEADESRRILRQLSGQAVINFSYPKGRLAAQSADILKAAGYDLAVAGHGRVDRRTQTMAVPRMPVTGDLDLAAFRAKFYSFLRWGRF